MKVKTLSALAGLGGALIMSGESQANYTGLTVQLHTQVVINGVNRSVFRVYANFTEGDDLLFSWNGPIEDPMQINGGGKNTPAVPNIKWGTFATIGVNIADQGSGPTPEIPSIDQTGVSPFFPAFIVGTSFLNSGAVFAPPQQGPTSQGRADYAPDGDGALRVLMMQLTVNAGGNVSGQVDVAVQLNVDGIAGGTTITFEDQSFNSVPAPGALALLGLAGLVGTRRRRA